MDLHVLRFPESKNQNCDGWPARVCLFAYVSIISIAQNQIIAKTSNFVFYIYIIRRCYSVYRGTQKNSYTLRPMDGFSC